MSITESFNKEPTWDGIAHSITLTPHQFWSAKPNISTAIIANKVYGFMYV